MEKKNNYGGKSDYRWSDEAMGAHLVTRIIPTRLLTRVLIRSPQQKLSNV